MAYTITAFTPVTIFTAMNLSLQSTCYTNNREFPDNDSLPAGPLGYHFLVYNDAIFFVPNLMFLLNNWLADGILVSSASVSVSQVVSNMRCPSSSIVAV